MHTEDRIKSPEELAWDINNYLNNQISSKRDKSIDDEKKPLITLFNSSGEREPRMFIVKTMHPMPDWFLHKPFQTPQNKISVKEIRPHTAKCLEIFDLYEKYFSELLEV